MVPTSIYPWLVCLCIYAPVHSHVVLTFPPARKLAIDFLDNARTSGPCGMPGGRGPITTIEAGSIIDVTWHIAYVHLGGFSLEIMNSTNRAVYRVPKTGYIGSSDTIISAHTLTIPPDMVCYGCKLRIVRQALDWSTPNFRYNFWSCADINIVVPISRKLTVTCLNGGFDTNGQCQCRSLYKGTNCQYKEDCEDDSDCNKNGKCHHTPSTSYPRHQCFCKAGWFGRFCDKRSLLRKKVTNYNNYTHTGLSSGFDLYHRILHAEQEVEVILRVKTNTWVALGIRPRDPVTPEPEAGTEEPVNPEPGTKEPVNPEPGTKEPVNPEPGTEEPVNPEPGTKEPVNPEPGTKPVNPEPGTKPVNPEPGTAEPVNPEPGTAEPVNPEPGTAEPVNPEPGTEEPVNPEPGTEEPVNSEPGTAEPVNPEPGTEEPVNPEPGTEEPVNPEPGTEKPVNPEPGTEKPVNPEPGTEEPVNPEPGTEEPVNPEPGTEEPVNPEPGTKEPVNPEPGTKEPGTAEPETPQPEGPDKRLHPMDKTDIVIGTAWGNYGRVGDYYTRDRSTPQRDEFYGGSESLTAALAYEDGEHTVVMFRKPLTATDVTDYNITNNMMHVIWARGQEAAHYKRDEVKYHGRAQNRGKTSINFFAEKHKDDKMAASWSVQVDNRTFTVNRWYSRKNHTIHVEFSVHIGSDKIWVAIGFSSTVAMTDTDVIVAWVDSSNRPVVSDRWNLAYAPPDPDKSNDLLSSSATLVGGRITVKFSRRATTSDILRDYQFSDSNCPYVIHAVGGSYNELTGRIYKHTATPVVSAGTVCFVPPESKTTNKPGTTETMSEPTSAPKPSTYEPSSTPEPTTHAMQGTWSRLVGSHIFVVSWLYSPSERRLNFKYFVDIGTKKIWVGLGFSNNTKMMDTDAVIAWLAPNGVAVVSDRWITGYSAPRADPSADLHNMSVTMSAGVITVSFSRNATTDDTDRDYQFSEENCPYMIHAVGGGYDETSGAIYKHAVTPVISYNRVCFIGATGSGLSCTYVTLLITAAYCLLTHSVMV